MRILRRTLAALLLAGVVATHASRGHAAPEEPHDIDLAYEAPAGCPSRAALIAAVDRRIDPQLRSLRDRRSFAVRIVGERARYVVDIEVKRAASRGPVTAPDAKPEPRPETRRLEAATCKGAVEAASVAIAIALDPASDPSPTDAPTSPSPPRDTPAEDPAPGPALPMPLPPPSSEGSPGRSATPRTRAEHLPARPETWRWTAFGHVELLRAPQTALGVRVGGELAVPIPRAPIVPALRVSWGYADFDAHPENSGTAEFQFRTGRAQGCAIATVRTFDVVPCLGLELGSLVATSRDIPQVGQSSTPWTAALATMRGGWSPLPWLTLELEIGGKWVFTRTTFALSDPIRVVYRAPTTILDLAAGLGATARFR